VQARRLRRGVLQRRRQISVGQVRCWRLGQRRDGVGDRAGRIRPRRRWWQYGGHLLSLAWCGTGWAGCPGVIPAGCAKSGCAKSGCAKWREDTNGV